MRRLKPTRLPRRKPTRRVLLQYYRALRRHYGHRHWWPGETPFEVMIGAILTQNTAWTNVEKAIQSLKQAGPFNHGALHQLEKSRLASLIRPAGYFNIKADRLKSFLDFFESRYGGSEKRMFQTSWPKLREELLAVKGIGEETADSILLYAGNKPSFVVDAYTRRVLKRHRYLGGNEAYGEIQQIFTELLPRSVSLYNDFHAQIVEVGKDFCRSTPRCEACPLRRYL